ncbi:hypothetical protein N2V14_004097 [Vibrio fluvialis]|nr:hypothetical protein [Vibrio fluvialis]
MATTLQLVENVRTGRFVTIDGQRCEVERASFTKAIDEKIASEELFTAMIQGAHNRGLINQDDDRQWCWVDTGKPLVSSEDWED